MSVEAPHNPTLGSTESKKSAPAPEKAAASASNATAPAESREPMPMSFWRRRSTKIGGSIAGLIAATGGAFLVGRGMSSGPEGPQVTASAPANPNSQEASPSANSEMAKKREQLELNGVQYARTDIIPDAAWKLVTNGSRDFSDMTEYKTAAGEVLSILEGNKNWIVDTGALPPEKATKSLEDVVRATFTNGAGNGTDFPSELVANNDVIASTVQERATSTTAQQHNPDYPLKTTYVGNIVKLEATKVPSNDGSGDSRIVSIIADVTEVVPDPDKPGAFKKITQRRAYSLTTPDTTVTGFSDGESRQMTTIAFEDDSYGDKNGHPTVIEAA